MQLIIQVATLLSVFTLSVSANLFDAFVDIGPAGGNQESGAQILSGTLPVNNINNSNWNYRYYIAGILIALRHGRD